MAVAVICEFNPFHNGHAYLLREARRLTNAPVVCVMSGSFTSSAQWVIGAVAIRPSAGITVTPISALTVTEAGGTAQFSVVLDTAPTANVTIALSSSDTTEGTLSASSLTFTSANWNVVATDKVKGSGTIELDEPVSTRYLLVYFTKLPPTENGYKARLHEVTVK